MSADSIPSNLLNMNPYPRWRAPGITALCSEFKADSAAAAQRHEGGGRPASASPLPWAAVATEQVWHRDG
jgi:hypothetical protein